MDTLSFIVVAVLASVASAAGPALTERHWDIEGVQRDALLHIPAAGKPAPVIFAFHGHGGSMKVAAQNFGYHTLWPEAIVVYMQGLPTIGKKVDPEGKQAGWQNAVGLNGDRDLKFFDAVLASLRQDYKIDEKRIYVTGHSNGGGFTYLLWAERGDVFAAVAPSSSGTRRADIKPLPALHLAGKADEIVPFEGQKRTMDAIGKINGCDPAAGKPWASSGPIVGTIYGAQSATPLVTLIHPGPHKFPPEAPALIVRFFREHAKP